MEIEITDEPVFITKEYKGTATDNEGNPHMFYAKISHEPAMPTNDTYEIDWFFKGVPRDLRMREEEIIEYFKQKYGNSNREETKMGEL